MDTEKNLSSCWQLQTSNSFEHTADTLERFVNNMVRQNLTKVYCKGCGDTGRLVIPREEVYQVINFLRTIKDMEELG